jgi:hypothetical protein
MVTVYSISYNSDVIYYGTTKNICKKINLFQKNTMCFSTTSKLFDFVTSKKNFSDFSISVVAECHMEDVDNLVDNLVYNLVYNLVDNLVYNLVDNLVYKHKTYLFCNTLNTRSLLEQTKHI